MTAGQGPARRRIRVNPIAGAIGAEIEGLDLSTPPGDEVFAVVHRALLDYLVIFLTGLAPLEPSQLTAFAALFGDIDREPFVHPFRTPPVEGHPEVFSIIKEASHRSFNIGGFWHTDVTYRERPHLCSVIYARETPAFGGDTMFANQYLAWETLNDAMKKRLDGMRAIHSSAMPHGGQGPRFAAVARHHAPDEADHLMEAGDLEVTTVEVVETSHPVVRRHPETGRKALYVNRGFTSRFEGMTESESLPLLEDLWNHAVRPEFTCRYRWSNHVVGIWDNRVVQHYAVNDYFGQRRHMQRVSVHEPSRPV